MEKINVAELLKDCPSGMKLDCTLVENLYFDCINYSDDPFPIQCYTQNRSYRTSIRFNEYGHYYTPFDNSKCVIFPEGKTTWEGFQRPFRDGDVIFVYNNESGENFHYKYIAIFKEIKRSSRDLYVHGFYSYNDDIFSIHPYLCEIETSTKIKFATEEQKEKLFNLIKIKGYEWNEEIKTLEQLIETKFEDGDIIFTHTGSNHNYASIFKQFSGNSYCTYIDLCINDNDLIIGLPNLCHIEEITTQRLATDEEKQNLFDAIKAKGYEWNAKTKALEELIEPIFKAGDRIKLKGGDEFGIITEVADCFYTIKDKNNTHCWSIKKQDDWELVPDKFDITILKPFDKVLVRSDDKHVWEIQFFERLNNILEDSFVCMGRERYHQCIPYEGNEHLLNTAKDCNEFFKTWK